MKASGEKSGCLHSMDRQKGGTCELRQRAAKRKKKRKEAAE